MTGGGTIFVLLLVSKADITFHVEEVNFIEVTRSAVQVELLDRERDPRS
jgi:hypothetical protein